MEFNGRVNPEGGITLGAYQRAAFVELAKKTPGMMVKISPILPESNKARRYLEGCIIPLVAYYQEGMDHRSSGDCEKIREWLKLEFNAETVIVSGKSQRVAKSTKGRDALNRFIEAVITWLQENYAPPAEALDPEHYKLWRDTVMDGPANYIDWMVEQKILK